MRRRVAQLSPSEGDGLRNALRRAGLRVTLPRLAVLRALREANAPLSHGDVALALVDRGLDRATVYRNLLDLVRVGLARRTDLGDHVWRFEAMTVDPGGRGPGSDEHPHFVCNACGMVECLDDVIVQLSHQARVPRALRRQAVEILVKGRCDRCA
jgi:Fur family ferric uptake transcriptional regulator